MTIKTLFQAALAAVLTGCGAACPPPETGADGRLAVKDGVTLKCQIHAFSGGMKCAKPAGAPGDSLACTNGWNRGAVFFFDKKGVLQSHEYLEEPEE